MKRVTILLIMMLVFISGCNMLSSSAPAKDQPATSMPELAAAANSSSTEKPQTTDPSTGQNASAENLESTSGNCFNEYYPVKSGATWAYTMNSSMSGEDSFTRTILNVSETGFTDQDTWAIGTVRSGEWTCDHGNLTALSQGGMGTVSANGVNFEAISQESSGVTYPSPLGTGSNWGQHLVISGNVVISDGMSVFATNDTTQSCTDIGEESVTVPAGTFDALKLSCTASMVITTEMEGVATDPISITSTSEVWMVKGVGMVKLVDSNEMADSTILLNTYSIP